MCEMLTNCFSRHCLCISEFSCFLCLWLKVFLFWANLSFLQNFSSSDWDITISVFSRFSLGDEEFDSQSEEDPFRVGTLKDV